MLRVFEIPEALLGRREQLRVEEAPSVERGAQRGSTKGGPSSQAHQAALKPGWESR